MPKSAAVCGSRPIKEPAASTTTGTVMAATISAVRPPAVPADEHPGSHRQHHSDRHLKCGGLWRPSDEMGESQRGEHGRGHADEHADLHGDGHLDEMPGEADNFPPGRPRMGVTAMKLLFVSLSSPARCRRPGRPGWTVGAADGTGVAPSCPLYNASGPLVESISCAITCFRSGTAGVTCLRPCQGDVELQVVVTSQSRIGVAGACSNPKRRGWR